MYVKWFAVGLDICLVSLLFYWLSMTSGHFTSSLLVSMTVEFNIFDNPSGPFSDFVSFLSHTIILESQLKENSVK